MALEIIINRIKSLCTWFDPQYDGMCANIIKLTMEVQPKLDKIQIYTEMYEYKIKNVLFKISSYAVRMAEIRVLKATITAE